PNRVAVTVTVTPPSGAPDWPRTVPWIWPVGACAWASTTNSTTQPTRQTLVALIGTTPDRFSGGRQRTPREPGRCGARFERCSSATRVAYARRFWMRLPGTHAGNSPPAAPDGSRDSARVSCSFIELNRPDPPGTTSQNALGCRAPVDERTRRHP